MEADEPLFCHHCQQPKQVRQPDPCLGWLPGVAHACCGHGCIGQAYVVGWKGCVPHEPVLMSKIGPRTGLFRYGGDDAMRYFETARKERDSENASNS